MRRGSPRRNPSPRCDEPRVDHTRDHATSKSWRTTLHRSWFNSRLLGDFRPVLDSMTESVTRWQEPIAHDYIGASTITSDRYRTRRSETAQTRPLTVRDVLLVKLAQRFRTHEHHPLLAEPPLVFRRHDATLVRWRSVRQRSQSPQQLARTGPSQVRFPQTSVARWQRIDDLPDAAPSEEWT